MWQVRQPPKESDYVGFTKCAACHFPQYKEWQLSEHGNAFEILPTKYKDDAECLQCHSTPVGQHAVPATVSGVSCEACHGPGGEHSRYALRFVNELITDEALKALRSRIHRIDANRCVKCHVTKAHKPHPKFDRDVRTRGRQTGRQAQSTKVLFNFGDVHRSDS